MTESAQLARRLGTGDAVIIGLGAMIGAGVFSAFAPAAAAAGAGLLIGLGVAAAVAYCNAVASAQLAAQYPTSGGTYVYGRERLGAWWGFVAGWGFVIGKTTSCAAMALTFASYAIAGPRWVQRLVALAAVVALTAANYRGISRTARLARALVVVSIAALLVVVAAIVTSGNANASRIGSLSSLGSGGLHGVLQAAGLLFFAFAGYARIATLGEEVRDPERTIPRAIPTALAIAVVLYLRSVSSRSPPPDRPRWPRARSRSPLRSALWESAGRYPSCGSERSSRASARCSPSSPGRPDQSGDGAQR